MKECCSEDNPCVFNSQHFSQCRPKGRAFPKSWPQPEILACTRTRAIPLLIQFTTLSYNHLVRTITNSVCAHSSTRTGHNYAILWLGGRCIAQYLVDWARSVTSFGGSGGMKGGGGRGSPDERHHEARRQKVNSSETTSEDG